MPVARWATALGLVLLSVAAPRVADAATGRALVFPFEGVDLPSSVEAEPERLSAVVELRFRADDYEIVASTMMLRDMMVAMACDELSTPCVAKLTAHFDVDVIVVGKLLVRDEKVAAYVRRYARDGSLFTEVKQALPNDSKERSAVYTRIAEAVVVGLASVAPFSPGVTPAPDTTSSPAGPTGEPASGRRRGTIRPPTIVVGALGVASGAAAIVTTLLTLSANQEFARLEERPLRTEADFEEAEGVVRRGKTLEILTPVFAGAAGVALGAAAVLAVLDMRSRKTVAAGVTLLPGGGATITLEVPWR